ncbi:MAG: YfiR family protein [Hydrogenophaga sp.]|nr:YfiR family protein [Hydrogenophaga sp.]
MRLLAHPPWLRAGLLALSCLLAVQAGTAAAQGVTDQAVKAGFVFNFIRFTQWPGVRPDDAHPLLLCAVGERPLDGQLVSLNGRRVDGRAVEVRMQVPPAEWPSCHMLFIGMGDRTESVLRGVGNLPVLTVGDQNGFVQAGGMIGLRVEDSRVRFDVNLAAAHRAGLTLNSQMLKLAGQVLK